MGPALQLGEEGVEVAATGVDVESFGGEGDNEHKAEHRGRHEGDPSHPGPSSRRAACEQDCHTERGDEQDGNVDPYRRRPSQRRSEQQQPAQAISVEQPGDGVGPGPDEQDHQRLLADAGRPEHEGGNEEDGGCVPFQPAVRLSPPKGGVEEQLPEEGESGEDEKPAEHRWAIGHIDQPGDLLDKPGASRTCEFGGRYGEGAPYLGETPAATVIAGGVPDSLVQIDEDRVPDRRSHQLDHVCAEH